MFFLSAHKWEQPTLIFPAVQQSRWEHFFFLWLFENSTPELQGACPAPFAEFFEDRSKNNYGVMASASFCERVLTLTLHNHSRKAHNIRQSKEIKRLLISTPLLFEKHLTSLRQLISTPLLLEKLLTTLQTMHITMGSNMKVVWIKKKQNLWFYGTIFPPKCMWNTHFRKNHIFSAYISLI